jgi:hypothetical protein
MGVGFAARSPDTMCVDRTPIVQALVGMGWYGARYDAVNVQEGESVLSVVTAASQWQFAKVCETVFCRDLVCDFS